MTDDDKKLVEMLRDDHQYILVEGHNVTDWDSIEAQRFEAADRIEQLEREKAVVSDLWEQQKQIALDYLADCNKAAEHIEAQAAEIERLREALRQIANIIPPIQTTIARAALGETE
jgi:molybdopterin-guanine dinucleotide biosynthesis protein